MGLQDGDALRAEIDALRRRLAEKDAQVLTGEERLSRLEAVHRVAQVGFCLHSVQSGAGQRWLVQYSSAQGARVHSSPL